MKTLWLPNLVEMIMLTLVFSHALPYGYYILLRWVVTATFSFLLFKAYHHISDTWKWVLGIMILVYNPILPLDLGRDIWTIVNVVTIIIILLTLFIFRRKKFISTG